MLVHVGGGLVCQLAATVLGVLGVGGEAALDLLLLLELPQPAARTAALPSITAKWRLPDLLTQTSLVRMEDQAVFCLSRRAKTLTDALVGTAHGSVSLNG